MASLARDEQYGWCRPSTSGLPGVWQLAAVCGQRCAKLWEADMAMLVGEPRVV